MDNLLILGAGQYGNVVYEIAEASGKYQQIDFLDENNPVAIGKTTDIDNFREAYSCATVAIGNSEMRLELLEKLKSAGFKIPALISERAYVSKTAIIEEGSVIEPLAVVHSNVHIKKGCLVCAGAVVNHNGILNEGCQIDCNATVCANAVMPRGTKLNCGSTYSK